MSLDLNDLIERLNESITVYDREARLVFMNETAIRPFGKAKEELLGKCPWELVQQGPPTPFRVALESVLAGAEKQHVVSHAPGIDRWYEVDVYPHPDGALALARDITESRRVTQELRESESRYRAMVEFAPEAIFVFDSATGKFSDANPEAVKLFGRSREELLDMSPLDLSPPMQGDSTSSDAYARYLTQLMATGAADFDWVALGPRGQPLAIELHIRAFPGANPAKFLISVLDVSARKRAQDQLTQVQRLEAIARLAGGVAHDFNNMLTIILGGTELAMRYLPAAEPSREILVGVLDAAQRASLITRQLLAFARNQAVSPLLLDLSAYVERLKPVLGRMVGEDVVVELDLAKSLGSILIDPAHVEQILLNLAANARDAMPRGGRLIIHTANVLLDGEYERLHNGVPPGRYVLLTISDTGEGISEAVKPHIFEPFFTTKALDRGTGLGLATVHGLVKQNRGHIWVYSELGMGTTFKLYFPIADGSPTAEERRAPGAVNLDGTETVLLVEDEDGVREFLRRVLQRAGYTVLEARNAGEALLIFEQHEAGIDMLLTDVVMPRMTGPQLAVRLRKVRSNLRTLYVSGYTEERVAYGDAASAHDGFISKPVTIDGLLTAVRGVLDR